jgi:hypothetical protein
MGSVGSIWPRDPMRAWYGSGVWGVAGLGADIDLPTSILISSPTHKIVDALKKSPF